MKLLIIDNQTGETKEVEFKETVIENITATPTPTIEERVSTIETVQGEVIRILAEVL